MREGTAARSRTRERGRAARVRHRRFLSLQCVHRFSHDFSHMRLVRLGVILRLDRCVDVRRRLEVRIRQHRQHRDQHRLRGTPATAEGRTADGRQQHTRDAFTRQSAHESERSTVLQPRAHSPVAVHPSAMASRHLPACARPRCLSPLRLGSVSTSRSSSPAC
jgi:hypothetical protein